MRITDITVTKKGHFALFVDGEFTCSLHPDIFARAGLHTGDAAQPEDLEELREESSYLFCKERALRLLGIKDYTCQELYAKLSRYADEQSAARAVERMQQLGLVDDADYARRLVRDLSNLRRYGPARIEAELRRRGVDALAAQQAMEQLEDIDERANIAQVLRRKYGGFYEDEKIRRRAVGALQRLGYRFDDILYVMAHADEFEPEP